MSINHNLLGPVDNLLDQSKKQMDQESLIFAHETRALIELTQSGERFWSKLIGLEFGRYVIVKPSPACGSLQDWDPQYPITVRYIFDGKIHVFSSFLLWTQDVPFRLVFLKYPQRVEKLNLRSGQRVNAIIPADLWFEKQKIPALIVNISSGGCGVMVRQETVDQLYAIKKGLEVTLNFELFNSSASMWVAAEIKNVGLEKTHTFLGLSFERIDDQSQKRLKTYLQNVLEYINGGKAD